MHGLGYDKLMFEAAGVGGIIDSVISRFDVS